MGGGGGILLVGIILLLTITFVTCEGVTGGQLEQGDEDWSKIIYREDGVPLIPITLGVPTPRALTGDLARAGTNYYEVTFRNGSTGEVFRAAWFNTQVGRIRLTPGNYSFAGGSSPPATAMDEAGAVLFAGNYEDKLLLAVGLATSVDGGGTTIASIGPATTSITFTLQALNNNIAATVNSSGTGAATIATASTFQITAPVDGARLPTTNDFTTKGTPSIGDYRTWSIQAGFPTVKYRESDIPVYVVPENDTVEAKYIIGLGTTGTAYRRFISSYDSASGDIIYNGGSPATPFVLYNTDTPDVDTSLILITGTQIYSTGVFVDGDTSVEPVTVTDAHILPDGESPNDWDITSGRATPDIMVIPEGAVPFPNSGLFDVEFTTPDKNAYTSLAFKVEVNAITNTTSTNGMDPITWIIQGGIYNHRYDEGITINSTGGAIVVSIGDTPSTTAGIEIRATGP